MTAPLAAAQPPIPAYLWTLIANSVFEIAREQLDLVRAEDPARWKAHLGALAEKLDLLGKGRRARWEAYLRRADVPIPAAVETSVTARQTWELDGAVLDVIKVEYVRGEDDHLAEVARCLDAAGANVDVSTRDLLWRGRRCAPGEARKRARASGGP